MYLPTSARKFKLRPFSMEIDRKKRAILMSMVFQQIRKLRFLKSCFLQANSYKCVSPIVAAVAAAAAAKYL